MAAAEAGPWREQFIPAAKAHTSTPSSMWDENDAGGYERFFSSSCYHSSNAVREPFPNVDIELFSSASSTPKRFPIPHLPRARAISPGQLPPSCRQLSHTKELVRRRFHPLMRTATGPDFPRSGLERERGAR